MSKNAHEDTTTSLKAKHCYKTCIQTKSHSALGFSVVSCLRDWFRLGLSDIWSSVFWCCGMASCPVEPQGWMMRIRWRAGPCPH